MTVRIGLTGSMATGKSTVLAAFAEFGARTLSADRIVHELYAGTRQAGLAVRELGARFAEVIVEGQVDRQRLSEMLAVEPQRLNELEAIVHPLVRAEIADFMQACISEGVLACVVEVPLLFESGYDYGFDRIAVTVCRPDIQRQRILARPGMSVEKLERLLARQMPQDQKKNRADYLFDTSTSIETTRAEVRALMAKFKAERDQIQ